MVRFSAMSGRIVSYIAYIRLEFEKNKLVMYINFARCFYN